MYSDGQYLYFSMFKKTDNLIDQQLPMIFFFILSVDLFASSGKLLKGLTSTFNKDDGSTYNEKTWLLGIAFDTSISPTCLKVAALQRKRSWLDLIVYSAMQAFQVILTYEY